MTYEGIGKSIGAKIDEIIKNQKLPPTEASTRSVLLRNQLDKKNVRIQALEFLTSVSWNRTA